MLMYPKDSKDPVEVSIAQVEVLEKAGWSKNAPDAKEAQDKEAQKPAQKPAVKK